MHQRPLESTKIKVNEWLLNQSERVVFSCYAPWPCPYTSSRPDCISVTEISDWNISAKMASSTCPPHRIGFRMKEQYSATGFPNVAAFHRVGAALTASTIMARSSGAVQRAFPTKNATAWNKQLLSSGIFSTSKSHDAPVAAADSKVDAADAAAEGKGPVHISHDFAVGGLT